MAPIHEIDSFNMMGKRVLVRCDFNVPLGKNGEILEEYKIKESIPTIKRLIDCGAKIILMSHLGDPGGVVKEELRLNSVKAVLERLLGQVVYKTNEPVGIEAKAMVASLKPGEILLLENLRFNAGEKNNDQKFSEELASFADIYINDAFAECHRPYASIIGVPKYLVRGRGLLLKKEVEAFDKIIINPNRPLVAIVGGVKVETKAPLIKKLAEVADTIIVSGPIQKEIISKKITFNHPEKIISPIDEIDGGLDIGIRSIRLFENIIVSARTVFWNGPFGMFENDRYVNGSKAISYAIVNSGAYSVIGGGETVAFNNRLGYLNKFSHVSTGGGAMLAYLSGETLCGIKALE
ncbi:MAG: phosphoglycerate kinase [bacterium]